MPIIQVMLLVVIGAISEELLFRAFAQGGLSHLIGPWWSVIVVSFAFGALHGFFRPPLFWWSMLALVWGFVLGVLMLFTGSILVPVVVHVIINVSGVLHLKFFPDKGN
jgi:membrane protease YdiL (CAAX protease family)